MDRLLARAGRQVKNYHSLNLSARGQVAIWEFPLTYMYADSPHFFEGGSASQNPGTDKPEIFDLRTNQHLTVRANPFQFEHLQDFVAYSDFPNRPDRQETERFRSFTCDRFMGRDKTGPDMFWLKDESLKDSENLPDPDVLAAEIVENLQAALELFGGIYEDLSGKECGRRAAYWY